MKINFKNQIKVIKLPELKPYKLALIWIEEYKDYGFIVKDMNKGGFMLTRWDNEESLRISGVDIDKDINFIGYVYDMKIIDLDLVD
jgi:hypothetical protein